jgi:hypothetical protein
VFGRVWPFAAAVGRDQHQRDVMSSLLSLPSHQPPVYRFVTLVVPDLFQSSPLLRIRTAFLVRGHADKEFGDRMNFPKGVAFGLSWDNIVRVIIH